MENYIVSARKYRPSTFRSVVGQKALVQTLKNAIISGRLAHSYLFCGQRGVGKTTMARIFAKAINCEHLTAEGEPCNECESCRAFNEQRSMNIIELDAASNNSVDDIRQLTDQVMIPPAIGRYRVFIVDEVHMLSTAAFNAFLKTLEEPPHYVIFILATTERQKILPTILSRCQKYDFQRITPADIADQLKYVADCEGYSTEPEALNVIAQKADGALRDALSIFDQVAASSLGNITYQATIDNLNILDYDYYFRLVEAFLTGNVEQSLIIFKEVRDHGFDSKVFINGVANHLRELVVSKSPELVSLMEVTGEIAEHYKQQAAQCNLSHLYAAMDLCNTCDLNYNNSTNKRFIVELTLIKICQLFCGNTAPQATEPPMKKVAPTATPQATQPAPQQAAPRPATTATPQPPRATPLTPVAPVVAKAGATVSGLNSVSIRTISEPVKPLQPSQAEKKNDTPIATPQARSEKYTEEQMQDAWRNYVLAHSKDEVILTNAMKAGFPKPSDKPDVYEVTFDNQAQIDKYELNQRDVMAFLRNELKNDAVMVTAKVRAKDANEKIWTQKELLLDMVERNPSVQQFISKYKLGFA